MNTRGPTYRDTATGEDIWFVGGEEVRVPEGTRRDELLRAQIRADCRADILARFPDWKQANLTARAVELLEQQFTGTMTSEDQVDLDAIRAAWGWIKQRRVQSDEEEAALDRS
jgi:hypothetical protein